MKTSAYLLNILLCALWALWLGAWTAAKAFYPAVILPAMGIPMLLGVNLAALLLERFLRPAGEREWLWQTLLAAVAFGLLPLCAGLAEVGECVKLAIAGGGVFLVSGMLFDSLSARLDSGMAYPAAAFLLFLAGQGFANIFL